MLKDMLEFASSLLRALRIRSDRSTINNADRLVQFVHTRSAYVAQTSLYGYLKTRMGRKYVEIFKDPKFAPSLNAAKWQVFAACLSDLCVHSVALAAKQGQLDADEAAGLARQCYRQCVEQTFKGDLAAGLAPAAMEDFEQRCRAVIWSNAAIGANAFTRSPKALADASPVSEEFRRLDRRIVENSVRFRWNDIRHQLERRLDGAALCASWKSQNGNDGGPGEHRADQFTAGGAE